MKKIFVIISLFIVVILLCGCDDKEKIKVNGKTINTSNMEHKHCKRNGSLDGGEVKLEYELYYTGDVLKILKSHEEVISSSDEVLNTYENAYKSIHEHYKGLDHYDTNVVRGDTTVTSVITINYDAIDIDKLIEIEGEEDNIFENKVPKVSKWLELAQKFGTTCELVED